MFTDGADEILGKSITLVDISADFADKAFFLAGLGLGLDVSVIVSIGYAFSASDNFSIGHFAYEHSVRVEIKILFNFKRNICVYIFSKTNEDVAKNLTKLKRAALKLCTACRKNAKTQFEAAQNVDYTKIKFEEVTDNDK